MCLTCISNWAIIVILLMITDYLVSHGCWETEEDAGYVEDLLRLPGGDRTPMAEEKAFTLIADG